MVHIRLHVNLIKNETNVTKVVITTLNIKNMILMSFSISEQLQPAHPMAQQLKTMMNMNRCFHWVFALQGAKYLAFSSSRTLKRREKYISFAQLVLLSLYIF